MKSVLIIIMFVLAQAATAASIYKWVDEKGITHYSETPPPTRNPQTLTIRPDSTSGGSASTKSWREQEREFLQRRVESSEMQKKEEQDAMRKRAAQAQCQDAKRNLELLQEQVRVYRRNAKGEPEFLDDDKRPAEIEKARKEVEALCQV